MSSLGVALPVSGKGTRILRRHGELYTKTEKYKTGFDRIICQSRRFLPLISLGSADVPAFKLLDVKSSAGLSDPRISLVIRQDDELLLKRTLSWLHLSQTTEVDSKSVNPNGLQEFQSWNAGTLAGIFFLFELHWERHASNVLAFQRVVNNSGADILVYFGETA